MSLKKSVASAFIILMTSQAFAGVTENIKDYAIKVREASSAFTKLAKEARGNKDAIMNNSTFKDYITKFNLATKDQNRIAQAIADGKSNVVTAIYASIAAKDLIQSQHIKTAEMDQGITSLIKVASISGKGAATDPTLRLSADEMKDATVALKRKTDYSIDMLTWGKEEAETHVQVMKKTAEIYESMKTITAEEALVLAIMDVKKTDRDGALKVIRKLRDCV